MISQMYCEFEELLDCKFLPDYWSDEGISQASILLQKFGEDDWVNLQKHCVTKSEDWKIKCAEVLSESDPYKASIILKYLLDEESIAVKIATADAINSLCQDYGESILDGFDKGKIKNLESLYSTLGEIDSIVINSLLSKL